MFIFKHKNRILFIKVYSIGMFLAFYVRISPLNNLKTHQSTIVQIFNALS
jgi:hypothetical protein